MRNNNEKVFNEEEALKLCFFQMGIIDGVKRLAKNKEASDLLWLIAPQALFVTSFSEYGKTVDDAMNLMIEKQYEEKYKEIMIIGRKLTTNLLSSYNRSELDPYCIDRVINF